MIIELPLEGPLGERRLILEEELSSMGDKIHVTIRTKHGTLSVPVYKSDLIRAVRMLDAPFDSSPE